MEKCSWQCEHVKCTKLCSEPCDRELCEHPNKGLLEKCGHASIGVCGEKMPRLCRICNKDEVEEIFFGDEDEEYARFIELEDCKHIIEVQGLIHWMKSEPDAAESNSENANRSSIQLKKCPKCKTEIRNTKALNTFIQACLKDVHQVKLITCGRPLENRALQRDLNDKVKHILSEQLSTRFTPIFTDIFNKTTYNQPNKNNFDPKPKQLLVELNNKFTLAESLQQICMQFEKRNQKVKNICDKSITKFEERIHKAIVFIKEYRNSDQKRHDIETEISFLQIMGKVIVDANVKPFNETGKRLLNDAFELAHKHGSATENVQNEFKKIVNEAFKHSTGLGISLEEKNMVLQAMKLTRGHWFKCPNGHVYCIGDCGGATVESICPECKERIGGGNHSLRADNALATEMDGATEPAWPTNLQRLLRPFMDN